MVSIVVTAKRDLVKKTVEVVEEHEVVILQMSMDAAQELRNVLGSVDWDIATQVRAALHNVGIHYEHGVLTGRVRHVGA